MTARWHAWLTVLSGPVYWLSSEVGDAPVSTSSEATFLSCGGSLLVLRCAVLCLLQVHMLPLRLQVLLQALLRCAHRDALPEVHGVSIQHARLITSFLQHPSSQP